MSIFGQIDAFRLSGKPKKARNHFIKQTIAIYPFYSKNKAKYIFFKFECGLGIGMSNIMNVTPKVGHKTKVFNEIYCPTPGSIFIVNVLGILYI